LVVKCQPCTGVFTHHLVCQSTLVAPFAFLSKLIAFRRSDLGLQKASVDLFISLVFGHMVPRPCLVLILLRPLGTHSRRFEESSEGLSPEGNVSFEELNEEVGKNDFKSFEELSDEVFHDRGKGSKRSNTTIDPSKTVGEMMAGGNDALDLALQTIDILSGCFADGKINNQALVQGAFDILAIGADLVFPGLGIAVSLISKLFGVGSGEKPEPSLEDVIMKKTGKLVNDKLADYMATDARTWLSGVIDVFKRGPSRSTQANDDTLNSYWSERQNDMVHGFRKIFSNKCYDGNAIHSTDCKNWQKNDKGGGGHRMLLLEITFTNMYLQLGSIFAQRGQLDAFTRSVEDVKKLHFLIETHFNRYMPHRSVQVRTGSAHMADNRGYWGRKNLAIFFDHGVDLVTNMKLGHERIGQMWPDFRQKNPGACPGGQWQASSWQAKQSKQDSMKRLMKDCTNRYSSFMRMKLEGEFVPLIHVIGNWWRQAEAAIKAGKIRDKYPM